MFPQSLLGLCLGDGADGVLLSLVTNIAGQRHDGVDHVCPVLCQPGDGIDVPAVIDGHLDVLGGKARLLCLLGNVISSNILFYCIPYPEQLDELDARSFILGPEIVHTAVPDQENVNPHSDVPALTC